MIFLLQNDDVTLVEKRVVRAATYSLLFSTSQIIGAFLKNIPENISDSVIPVGTVEFVKKVMTIHGIIPPIMPSYPVCLDKFLHRKVWSGKFSDAQTDDIFVKPIAVKEFTGALIKDLEEE